MYRCDTNVPILYLKIGQMYRCDTNVPIFTLKLVKMCRCNTNVPNYTLKLVKMYPHDTHVPILYLKIGQNVSLRNKCSYLLPIRNVIKIDWRNSPMKAMTC